MSLTQSVERPQEENWGFPEEEVLPVESTFSLSFLEISDLPSHSPQSYKLILYIKPLNICLLLGLFFLNEPELIHPICDTKCLF